MRAAATNPVSDCWAEPKPVTQAALAMIMNSRGGQVKHVGRPAGHDQVSRPETSQSPSTFSMVTVTQFW
jgi:hypothetical protein